MTEPLMIIYSHTEYDDVLQLATKFLKNYKNKILLIDNNVEETKYNSQYIKIIRYDDKQPYASRILNIKSISEDVILFMHETDVLIKFDSLILNNLKQYMLDNKIDKIELQHCICRPPAKIPLKQTYNSTNTEIPFNNMCHLYEINNSEFFVYNVNPTLWRTKTLLNIMQRFQNYTYRQIEKKDVQQYTATNFKCFSLKCKEYVQCGYFTCSLFFQFIHLTHHGEFVQLGNKLDNVMDKEIYDVYMREIFEPYVKHSKQRKIRSKFP